MQVPGPAVRRAGHPRLLHAPTDSTGRGSWDFNGRRTSCRGRPVLGRRSAGPTSRRHGNRRDQPGLDVGQRHAALHRQRPQRVDLHPRRRPGGRSPSRPSIRPDRDLHGRLLHLRPQGTNQWFLSALYDGFSYDALQFASAEALPGEVVATAQNLQLLYVFTTSHIELWYNAGTRLSRSSATPAGSFPMAARPPAASCRPTARCSSSRRTRYSTACRPTCPFGSRRTRSRRLLDQEPTSRRSSAPPDDPGPQADLHAPAHGADHAVLRHLDRQMARARQRGGQQHLPGRLAGAARWRSTARSWPRRHPGRPHRSGGLDDLHGVRPPDARPDPVQQPAPRPPAALLQAVRARRRGRRGPVTGQGSDPRSCFSAQSTAA
jgi:hypothetical protein